jgi:guanylate kinase
MKKVLVVSGPSGIGKTYLAVQLVAKYPSLIDQVKLFTTRSSRPNEHVADRIFITEEEFCAKQLRGDFFIAEKFHGNWYGYAKKSLEPRYKHIIVNTWPALLPQFEGLPDICLIGLTTNKAGIDLLRQRMLERGDSADKVNERLKLVGKDISDLAAHEKTVKKYGEVFTVTDDQSIYQSVIPWIEKLLQPEAGVG